MINEKYHLQRFIAIDPRLRLLPSRVSLCCWLLETIFLNISPSHFSHIHSHPTVKGFNISSGVALNPSSNLQHIKKKMGLKALFVFACLPKSC